MDLSDIHNAYDRIRADIHCTPLLTSNYLNQMTGLSVFLKAEHLQKAGSFKIRGASNMINALVDSLRPRGVVAHSSGNHGQAVALAAHRQGIATIVVMPRNTPRIKVEAVRDYGSEVAFSDNTSRAREELADSLCKSRQATLIPPYDHPLIIAGQGTCALEIVQALPDVDVIFCPVSGGGLLSGTLIAAKKTNPKIKVIAVEPEGANDTALSISRGERVRVDNISTIADGLRVQIPGTLTFPILQKYLDDIVTVTETEIIEAMWVLFERTRQVVEPSGATSLAGLIKMREAFQGKRAAVILSGGNVELSAFFEPLLGGGS